MARNSVGMNLCYRCGISPHLYYIKNSDVWAVSCKNPKCDEYEKPVVHTKAIIAEQEWNKKQEFMKTKETIEKVYSMIEEFIERSNIGETAITEESKEIDYSVPHNIHEFNPPTILLVRTKYTDTYEPPVRFTNVKKYYYKNGYLCVESADSTETEYLDMLVIRDIYTIDELYEKLEIK